MKNNRFANRTAKFLSIWNLLLVIVCITINLGLSKLVILFDLPLYIDTIGTILAGALGGIVPGIAVGFLSNAINSFSDPVLLYYGVVSIVIGALSTVFSEKKMFKSVKGWLTATVLYVVIAGVAGVSVTWFVYGASIGGTSSDLGNALFRHGVSPYVAQLIADVVIEIPDKLFVVGTVCLLLHFCPKKIIKKMPRGENYLESEDNNNKKDNSKKVTVKKSLGNRITYIVMLGVSISCFFSIAVSLIFYLQSIKSGCEDFALVVSRQAAGYVDGDKIKDYLQYGESHSDYIKTEKNLKILYDNSSKVQYLFVYSIYDDGVHVVFDIDTPETPGEEPGTVLEPEQGVSENYKDYVNGADIPIEYSNGEYGNILTVYSKIYDSRGHVVAYAGVDIDMDTYYKDFAIFSIQVISIIFSIAMLIFTFVLWYINKRITRPIQTIVNQTEQLKSISPELWLDSEEWKNQIRLNTEDELAQLNDTVRDLEEKTSQNIKRLMETEQEIRESKKLAETNKKLEIAVHNAEEASKAKTEFLAKMSHDMRTPLNGVLNFSRFIMDSDSLEEAKNYGDKIFTSGNYLQTLINDTLGMSRIESGKLVLKPEAYTYAEFEASIKNVLESKAANKNVDLKFIPPIEKDTSIYTDPLRLQQICINILNNAIKFTPKGGSVIFHTETADIDKERKKIKISIADSGVGMSKKFMEEQLYMPFAQENVGKDNEETGTGLGLSIAKQLVDIMGGSISCTSEPGVGTTFTITLVAKKTDEKQMKDNAPIMVDQLKGVNILLCEDHKLNREIALKLLHNVGCIVDVAENGQEGVNKFSQAPDAYDVILMDIRMPVMDGISATKAIRGLDTPRAKTIPIIAMTANAYEDDIAECLKAGMNAHIAKPINPKDMYQVIGENLK